MRLEKALKAFAGSLRSDLFYHRIESGQVVPFISQLLRPRLGRYTRCSYATMANNQPAPEPVIIDGKKYRSVKEGLASVLAPYQATEPGLEKGSKSHNNAEGNQAVFYNPIQQFNRDLTVLAILIYGEGALLTKASTFAKKAISKRARRKGKKEVAAAVEATETESNPRKRRSEEIDDAEEAPATKRNRAGDAEPEDDELEVAQLNGGEENGTGNGDIGGQQESASQKPLPFSILDALSATGLRALRYAKEIPFATNIIANDMSKDAVAAIELNIDHNDVKGKVHSNVGDARSYMYSKIGNEHAQPSGRNVHRFDVVDLDPYGTAAPFLDSALQCLGDGGLLCVTCTDAGVFASSGYLEKTYALYGGLPIKGAHSHEAGLRLIIHSIAQTAAKYGVAIEPLLSLSIDFYARIFIRIHKKPNEVKLLAGTTMVTYSCDQGCGAWTTQTLARNIAKEDRAGNVIYKHSFAQAPSVPPSCEHCGYRMHLGGPMWAGPLHNPYFVQRMLDRLPSLDPKVYGTIDRLRGMLTVALEEDLTLAATTSSDTNPSTSTNAPSKSPSSQIPNPALIPRLPPTTLDASPFFIIPNYLAKVLHASTPSEDLLRGAIRSAGYRVTRSHCKAGSFKTDAPWSVLWEIFREWVRQKAPIKEGAIKKGSPGARILAGGSGEEGGLVRGVRAEVMRGVERSEDKEELERVLRAALYRLEHGEGGGGVNGQGGGGVGQEKLKVVFDEKLGREKARGRLVRYQINPRENWGPMNRAGGS